MTEFEALVEKMYDLEKRVLALEERTRRFAWSRNEELSRKEEALVAHGAHVDKSTAAQILFVTRATVYAMLEDGRIEGACEGKRVDVRSIARYIYSGKPKNKGEKACR